MDKFLITGFSGFVSRHFMEYLESLKQHVIVSGMDISVPEFDFQHYEYVQCHFNQIDLLAKDEIERVIYNFQPHYILHLASYSSVAFSWKNPVQSFRNNTNIFLNLIETVRGLNLDCRILSIGSSEEYGNVLPAQIPLQEDQFPNPISPYAVARVAQEMLSRVFVDGYNMDIVLTRSFNHIGPYQKDLFVISSFAKQLLEIKKGQRPAELHTGNLDIIRDFIDVRDVVRAYYELFKKGEKGLVYNICSGRGISIRAILQQMMEIVQVQATIKTDPALVRPNDNQVIIGNNERIREATGWHARYALDESLKDIITYWNALV